MAPVIVMRAGIGLSALRFFGVEWAASWKVCARVGLACMFLFASVAHFTKTRGDFVRMVPPSLPNAGAMVTITGLAELAGAAGLLISATAKYAAYALIVLLLVMLPANIYAARKKLTGAGRSATPLRFAFLCKDFWIALLLWSATE